MESQECLSAIHTKIGLERIKNGLLSGTYFFLVQITYKKETKNSKIITYYTIYYTTILLLSIIYLSIYLSIFCVYSMKTDKTD